MENKIILDDDDEVQNIVDFSSYSEQQLTQSDERIISIIQDLNENPYNSDNYRQAISFYIFNNNEPKATEMLEKAVKHCILPLVSWKEYILFMSKSKDKAAIDILYQKALSEFEYIELCSDYIEFLSHTKETSTNLRTAYEQVLEIWGLDYTLSSPLWISYMKHEISLLESANSDKESILKSIRSIIKRKIKFPVDCLNELWILYSKSDSKAEVDKIKKSYEEAKSNQSSYSLFAKELSSLCYEADPTTQTLKSLKKIAEKYPNYYFLQILKTQATKSSSNIWDMLPIVFNRFHELAYSIKEKWSIRYTKSCPLASKSWVRLIRVYECKATSIENVKAAIQVPLKHIPDAQFQLDLLKEISEYVLRNAEAEYKEKAQEAIRSQYNGSIEALKQLKEGMMLADLLLLNLAEIECYRFKDKQRVIEIMESYLKKQANNESAKWQAYISFIRSFGDNEKMRKICIRAFECSPDREAIASSWFQWEQKYLHQ